MFQDEWHALKQFGMPEWVVRCDFSFFGTKGLLMGKMASPISRVAQMLIWFLCCSGNECAAGSEGGGAAG